MPANIEELQPDLRALLGQVIDNRYRIEGLLGVGGMAAVFRATHLGLRREVAIKVIDPDLGAHTQASARFDREAESASRLDHPNCVRVSDYGANEAGMKYLVMELLEGQELTELLGRPMSARRAVELISQVLSALNHAHEHGVVHRDLKPENIFVTRDESGRERVKLVDFGISRLADDGRDQPLTRAGLIFGTPEYMSPEQALGRPADARADLYAAGLVLYAMLTGRQPFEGPDAVSIITQQVTRPLPPLPHRVPGDLKALVEKLTAKAVEERYASAADAITALRQLNVPPERRPTLARASATMVHLASVGVRGTRTAIRFVRDRLPRSRSELRTLLAAIGAVATRIPGPSTSRRWAIAAALGAALAILAATLWVRRDPPGPPEGAHAQHAAVAAPPTATGSEPSPDPEVHRRRLHALLLEVLERHRGPNAEPKPKPKPKRTPKPKPSAEPKRGKKSSSEDPCKGFGAVFKKRCREELRR